MELEKQVTSLQLSKKLKELGVKQNSIFVWEYYNDQCHGVKYIPYAMIPNNNNKFKIYSAFTVAELGIDLPATCHTSKITGGRSGTKETGEWVCYLGISSHPLGFYRINSDTEVNARAEMLIYLIENNLIEINK